MPTKRCCCRFCTPPEAKCGRDGTELTWWVKYATEAYIIDNNVLGTDSVRIDITLTGATEQVGSITIDPTRVQILYASNSCDTVSSSCPPCGLCNQFTPTPQCYAITRDFGQFDTPMPDVRIDISGTLNQADPPPGWCDSTPCASINYSFIQSCYPTVGGEGSYNLRGPYDEVAGHYRIQIFMCTNAFGDYYQDLGIDWLGTPYGLRIWIRTRTVAKVFGAANPYPNLTHVAGGFPIISPHPTRTVIWTFDRDTFNYWLYLNTDECIEPCNEVTSSPGIPYGGSNTSDTPAGDFGASMCLPNDLDVNVTIL